MYQDARKETHHAYVELPESDYKTALQVSKALGEGKIADLYLAPGAFLSVEKMEESQGPLSRGPTRSIG